jgi:hypothetical protein
MQYSARVINGGRNTRRNTVRRTKEAGDSMKTYRVSGVEFEELYGGYLPDSKMHTFLKEVKAKTPESAKRKVYNWSKRKRLGWTWFDLSVRTKRKSKG